ncbi:uncharacterized protein LOC134711743 [Mytilus trossulus]|uniref:uncharacterized protein LOC134711743 n=1 Tax=Mytilus trossulus TaxID=6551 RepID=UPI0030047F32
MMQCLYVIIFYSILTKVCSTLDTNILDLKVNCSLLQFWQKDHARENKSCDAMNAPVYHCAWNIFTLQYEEICRSKPILIRKGNRPTIQGGLHYGPCPWDHYQPFHVVSNLTVGCALQKTKCSGDGQVVYEDNDPESDTTCRCDYTKGYDFVKPPRHNCFCIPSQEDCTCYVKTCRNMLHVLDPEYNCVDEYNMSSYENNRQCLLIQLKKGAITNNGTSINSISLIDADSSSHNGITATITLCLFLFSGLVSFILFFTTPLKVIKRHDHHYHNATEGDSVDIILDVYGIALMKAEELNFIDDKKEKISMDKNDRFEFSISEEKYLHTTIELKINNVCLADDGDYEYSIKNLIGCQFTCQWNLRVNVDGMQAQKFENKKKRIIEHTEKRIQKHISEKTFFATTAVEKGITLLDPFHIVVLVGTEKCGKTEACLSICASLKAKGVAAIFMTTSNFVEAENMSYFVEKDKKELFVFDINMKPTEEDAFKNLFAEANLHASENFKIIFTIKTSIGKKVLEGFPQRQQVIIDSFTEDDKRGILMNHMQYNNIDECRNYLEANYEDLENVQDGEKIKIPRKVIDDIVEAETTGQFPELCKSFCSIRSLLPLEDRYFKNPSKSLIHDIHQLRSKPETKVLYVTLVYVLMKDTFREGEDQERTIDIICAQMKIDAYHLYNIKDAAIELQNKYNYLLEKSGRFMFSNDRVKKAVWISYMDINPIYCVMHCQWEYVSDLLRPSAWNVQDNDVCITVKTPELTRRLNAEMKDIGSAWSVGTYLRKLSEKGKELTDAFCACVTETEKHKNKTDILLSFFNGISDLGNYDKVFSFSKSIKDIVMWPHLDENDNSILHFCIIQDFKFMCNDNSEEFGKAFINMKNKKNYSPCAIAVYFGRDTILKKHAEQIPEEYEYYTVLKYMLSHGEKNASQSMKPNDLIFLDIDLPLNLVKNVKFGERKKYTTINKILAALKRKTMIMIRIHGLPPKIKNDSVKDTLTSCGCDVLKVYPEKYREKGDLTNLKTGDLIAVCKFTNKSLPSELTIREHNVTAEIMMRIKISKLPSYIKDYQIHNALSLQKCTVKELFPEMKQATGGKLIDYTAVCSSMENTLPQTIHIDQYECDTSVMTTIRFKNLTEQINASEIENLLRQHHYDVDNIYREKRRKEGKLTNIKTGDRIAFCKPFSHQLPPSLAFGDLPEKYKIQRE